MKQLFIVLSLLIISCSNESKKNQYKKVNNSHKLTTRYTYSQFNNVDFMVAEGSYQILYDLSCPIDSIFAYSGAFLIGQDSLIYTRIRKEKANDFIDENDKTFYGYTSNLILFNGKTFKKINPKLFDPYMSSFTTINKTLYYWGFYNGLYACQFNIKTKEFKKIKLENEIAGTDFFGYYSPPLINANGNIEFNIYDEKSWIIKKDLSKIIKKVEFSTDDDVILHPILNNDTIY